MSEFYWLTGVALVIDGALTLCTYIAYFKTKKLFDAFTKSLNDGINKVITSENSQEPQLGIICGSVKSIGPPIKSLNKPSVHGVIQKLTIHEHSVEKRAPGYWSDRKKILDEKWNVVPFEIKCKNYKIVITSPLEASYMNLEVIDDRFEPSISSVLNLLFGIHQKGIQYTEFLLKENAVVTAFGEFAYGEKGELQLKPPRNGVYYVLSTMDPETLSHKIEVEKKLKGVSCIAFTFIGLAILSIITYKLWKDRQARFEEERQKRELMQQRALRIADSAPENEDFTCIVCLSKRREVVLLPCGHVCLCYDCSVQLRQRPCPLCKQHVTDIHLVFIS